MSKIKIILYMVFILASINHVSAFSGGDGTSSNPYQVATLTDLQNVDNSLSSYYIQVADINASDTLTWNGGAGFEPIGAYFYGNYNGNGYNITHLYINRPSTSSVGLFHSTSGSTVTNITLINATIIGNSWMGGISGRCYGGTVVGAGSEPDYIIGCAVINSTIGNPDTSGLHPYAAGIVGRSTVGDVYISECAAIGGYVYGNSAIGGVVGGSTAIISDVWSSMHVNGTNAIFNTIGGIIGDQTGGDLNNSHSYGFVEGLGGAGGAVGASSGNVNNVYYDTNLSTQTDDTGKGEPKTTSEMQTQSTFTDWDFDYTWVMDGYPIFQADASPYIINPVIIYPENATEIDSEYPSLTDVDFEWTNNDGALSSSYQLSRDSNYNTLVSSGTTTNNYKTLSLDADDYYFRVRYYYDTGAYSDWAESQFSINTTVTDYGTAIQGVVYDITSGTYNALSGAKVTAYSSTYDTRNYVTGENGFYLFDDIEVGEWNLIVSKDGYETSSYNYANVTDGNTTTMDIYLEEENAPNYITPHYVEFIVRSWTTKYEDAEINIYVGDSATALVTLYTDSTGSTAYKLDETVKYRVTAYKEGIIDREVTITPNFDKFTFWVNISEIIDDILSGHNNDLADSVFITLYQEVVTGTQATITVDYNDTSETTASLEITLEQPVYADVGNYTVIDNVTYSSDSLVNHVFTLNNSVFYGETYIIHVVAETNDFGAVDKMYAVTFDPSDDVFGISIEIFIWILVALVIWFGSTATETSVYTTMFAMGCLTGVLKLMGLTGDYVSSFGIILTIVASIVGYLYQSERE